MNPQGITDITLARNQLKQLITIVYAVPEVMGFLEIDETMMQNMNQLNLGPTIEDDRLEEINKKRF